MKKGSITIYMTLVLSLLLSLFFAVIEGARYRAVSLVSECAFDLGVFSVFAEYQRTLLEEYDLFFVDTSYGEKDGSWERLDTHLKSYINQNLSAGTDENQLSKLLFCDLSKCFVEETDIKKLAYAVDDDGKEFESACVAYMKEQYGISYVEDLAKELSETQEKQLLTKDIKGEREANQSLIDNAKKETQKTDEEGNPVYEEIEIENPADGVNGSRNKGILLLVTDSDKLSQNEISLDLQPSHRGMSQKGVGLSGRETVSFAEELLFDAYILEKCGNYLEPKKQGALQYQAEYVVAGKSSDIENLKAVVGKLLLLRETSNLAYLYTDEAKMAEAEALAATVTTAVGFPELLIPVKLSLIFAWAFAESVHDVKVLLMGNKIPLMKSPSTWYYSLEGMLSYESNLGTGCEANTTEEIKDGMSYQDYLKLFIAAEKNTKSRHRMMDIVEMDIRKIDQDSQFYIDDLVDYMQVSATIGSQFGCFHETEMEWSYY